MNLLRKATWAYVIIVGGLMITPEGIVPINTNPVFRTTVGIIAIILGVFGFIAERSVSSTASKSTKA
ncbi:MAG TPA: hypothetical protein VHY08_01615 [Bacillota bacterium]|nr:hypothetical protein [Bacillota bacterium]